MVSKICDEVLCFFPKSLSEVNNLGADILEKVEEIRVRVGQAIYLRFGDSDFFLNTIASESDILKLLENFSNNSIYAFQNEINNGYLTIKGGHRVGISGTSIIDDNSIRNIKYISSLNIRVAHEIKGCSDKIFKAILKNNNFENTLIISPPRLSAKQRFLET